MMLMLERVSTFQDFQRIFKTTKLDRGLDDTPITDDNIAEPGRDIWDELLNNSESEHCFFIFSEYMEALRESNIGFDYQLLEDTDGRYTGCIWQTSNENIHVIVAYGFINQDCVTNKFGLPHATYMCGT